MRSDSRAWAQDRCAVKEAGGWEASAASGVTDKVSLRTFTFFPPNQAFTCGSQPWLGVRITRKDLLSLAGPELRASDFLGWGLPIGLVKISPGLRTAVLKEGKGLGKHSFPQPGVGPASPSCPGR